MTRAFIVGIMASAPGEIPATFLAAQSERLAAGGIQVGVLVLDENPALRRHPLQQRWRVAGRQARISGCTQASAMARLLVYQGLMGLASWRDPEPVSAFPEALRVIRVPNLNRPEAVAAITAASCDLVCLMGARIINGKTIAALRAPIVNIHSSDPRWVRGGPVVIWEVLDGRDYIQLTIHEVVEALDAGAMLATRAHGIRFSGGIGRTTRHTMRAARPHVADLFAGVIEQWRRDELRRTSFQPGQLRVTPPVSQTLRAELRCRRSLARRTY